MHEFFVLIFIFLLGCSRNVTLNHDREMGMGIPYKIENLNGSMSVVTLVKNKQNAGLQYEFNINMIESETRIFKFDKAIRKVTISKNRIKVTWDNFSPFSQSSNTTDINAEIETEFAVTGRNEIIKVDYKTLRDVVE